MTFLKNYILNLCFAFIIIAVLEHIAITERLKKTLNIVFSAVILLFIIYPLTNMKTVNRQNLLTVKDDVRLSAKYSLDTTKEILLNDIKIRIKEDILEYVYNKHGQVLSLCEVGLVSKDEVISVEKIIIAPFDEKIAREVAARYQMTDEAVISKDL